MAWDKRAPGRDSTCDSTIPERRGRDAEGWNGEILKMSTLWLFNIAMENPL